jgi:membrane-associated phospholipid phosphatase
LCIYEPFVTARVSSYSNERLEMALITVRPLKIDRQIASEVASHTDRRIEHAAESVTWGADEHVLAGVAVLGWLLSRRSTNESCRRFADHALVCCVTTAVLPHLMKDLIDQERPDRLTIEGHLNGIPISGKANDAFPSGHALHIGALASAATLLPAKLRNAVWAVGAVLVSTRIVLLAHWVSDVVVGLGLGVTLERLMRLATKPTPVER